MNTLIKSVIFAAALQSGTSSVNAQTTNDVNTLLMRHTTCMGKVISESELLGGEITDFELGSLFKRKGISQEILSQLQEEGGTNEEIFRSHITNEERIQTQQWLSEEIACQLGLLKNLAEKFQTIDGKYDGFELAIQKYRLAIQKYRRYISTLQAYGGETSIYDTKFRGIISEDTEKELNFVSHSDFLKSYVTGFPNNPLEGYNWAAFRMYIEIYQDYNGVKYLHSQKVEKRIQEMDSITDGFLLKQLDWMQELTEYVLHEPPSPFIMSVRLGGGNELGNSIHELMTRWYHVFNIITSRKNNSEALVAKLEKSIQYLEQKKQDITNKATLTEQAIDVYKEEERRKDEELRKSFQQENSSH